MRVPAFLYYQAFEKKKHVAHGSDRMMENEKNPDQTDTALVRIQKGIFAPTYSIVKTTGSLTWSHLLFPLVAPVLTLRPKEVITDALDYTIPFVDQTNACINYIKRRIRASVLNNDRENGTLTFSVDPKESWLLDLSRIDIRVVETKVNGWLARMYQLDKRYPRRITWVDYKPFRSKVNHDQHFIVHYFWSEPISGTDI